MLQVEDIQPFRGDETPEDSEKWLTNLVASTATFSESLIFRFFLPRLLGAPPVSEWFEGLGDSPKSSWSAFQEEFRTKWITDSRIRKEEDAWNEFTKHVLTEDMLFGAHLPDPEMIRNSISTWLQDHLRLGSATKRPDSELIQATYSLLPVFLSAHIQMFYDGGPLCFDSFDALKEVSDEVLNLQRVCHQINLRKRSKLMETTIKELSEKVDKLMDALDAGRAQSHPVSSHQSMPLSEVDQTPSENVNWEPCSPLTSVLSVLAPSSNTSEHSTPIPQLLPLSEASDRSMTVQVGLSGSDIAESRDDGTDEGIELQLFRIPDIWRKPAASISKDEKITIIQRAINFALAFKPSLAPNQASSLESAFAIYDRLSCHERDKQRSIGRSSSVDGTYQDILSAITGIHGYCAYDEPFLITNSMNIWARIAEGDDYYGNLVKSHQLMVHDGRSGHDYYDKKSLKMHPSGESVMAGGLFVFSSSYNDASIDSYRTVLFMALSCYLAECSGVTKYKDTAVLSANCVKTWMLDPATMLIKQCLINATTAEEVNGATLSSYLTGIAIEGFTVLSRVTGDESWGSLAIDMAVAAMKYDGWHDSNGILTVGCEGDASVNTDDKAFKGLLNRGLLVAYQRNRSNKHFCALVRSYINVQCNALLELSCFRSSYGPDWRGPYVGPYIHAQMAAIDTLIAALGVDD